MLHPLALAAVALLLLNDHLFKATFASWWTGKLSDCAGLSFFPLFLQALWEWGCAAARRFRGHSMRFLLGSAVATGLSFALVKTWEPFTRAYSFIWGALGWPVSAAQTLLAGAALPPLAQAQVVADSSDLIALPCLALALWVGRTPRR
ncbi:MAG: hypothetical protein QM765_32650 [Myxococcales bacterium]